MSDMATRIKQAMDFRGMKQVELCELTGIGKSSISTYLSGEYEPKQRNLFKIAEALQVNVAWLIGQDAPMLEENTNHVSSTVAPSTATFPHCASNCAASRACASCLTRARTLPSRTSWTQPP